MNINGIEIKEEGGKIKIIKVDGVKLKYPFTLFKLKGGEKATINGNKITVGNRSCSIPTSVHESAEDVWYIESGQNQIRIARISNHVSIVAGGVHTFQ